MNSTRKASPWLEGMDISCMPLVTGLEFDVAVIGAGITGLTTAHQLSRQGQRVIVLERRTVGHGESGQTTAHLSAHPDLDLSELIERFGEQAARRVWQGGMEAIKHIEQVCELEQIDAHFARIEGWLIARDKDGLQTVDDESRALKRLGVAHEIAHSPIRAERALQIPDQARFHLGRYLEGLARAAMAHCAVICEHSAVVSMTGGTPHRLEVSAPSNPQADAPKLGTVFAKRVIVATHVPIWTHYLVLDKLKPSQTYVIAAKVAAGTAPDALIDDTNDPYHYYRLEPNSDHDLVTFGGKDHPTGAPEESNGGPITDHYQDLERELGAWLPGVAFEVTHRWSGEVWASLDGLPYIGPDLTPAPQRFIATGYDGVGMTFGTLAGLMAADWAAGREHMDADLYAPSRLAIRDVGSVMGQGLGYVKQFLGDRIGDKIGELIGGSKESTGTGGMNEIALGQGAIIDLPKLGKVAASRNDVGTLLEVSAVCSHAGCSVVWNATDHSWDCPCHGSRFAPTGEVLAGPAVYPLKTFKQMED